MEAAARRVARCARASRSVRVFGQTPRRPCRRVRQVPSREPRLTATPPRTLLPSQSSLAFDVAFESIKHVDVRDAANAACACRAMRALTESELWWKRLSHRVGEEAKLYVPETDDGRPSSATWRGECFRLWACRHRWRAPVDETDQDPTRPRPGPPLSPSPEVEVGSIKVCVRMRPRGVGVLARVRLRTNAPPPAPHPPSTHLVARRGGATRREMCAPRSNPAGAPRRARRQGRRRDPRDEPDVEPATAASQPSPSSSSSRRKTARIPPRPSCRTKRRSMRRRRSALRDVTIANTSPTDATRRGFRRDVRRALRGRDENRVLAVPAWAFASSRTTPSSRTRPRRRRTPRRGRSPILATVQRREDREWPDGPGKTHTMFGEPRGRAGWFRGRRGVRGGGGARAPASSRPLGSCVEVYGNRFWICFMGAARGPISRRRTATFSTAAERPVTCMADVPMLAEKSSCCAATAMNDRPSGALGHAQHDAARRIDGPRDGVQTCLADLGGSEKLSKSRARRRCRRRDGSLERVLRASRVSPGGAHQRGFTRAQAVQDALRVATRQARGNRTAARPVPRL